MSVTPTGIINVTGISTGAAYADLDAVGTTAITISVPNSGIIHSAQYFNLDDDGLAVDLWLFDTAPAAQTDNSAFAVTDAELQTVIGVISFSSFNDANTGQVSTANGLNLSYRSLGGEIYAQVQARGALNIAASNLPTFRLMILP